MHTRVESRVYPILRSMAEADLQPLLSGSAECTYCTEYTGKCI